MSPSKHACNCPQTSQGTLPSIIYFEALKGNSEKVLEWLKDGGDINAAEMNFKTLVHIACEKNYIHLLKELLKFPEVHINHGNTLSSKNRGKGMTPLSLAMDYNHVECVKALLSSPSKCKIDLVKITASTGQAIRNALNRNNWKMIEILLNAGLTLIKADSTAIFQAAAKALEEDIVKIIIDREFPLYTESIDNLVFVKLYVHDLWNTVGAEKVFKQCFLNNNYWCFRVLQIAMDTNDFNMVENTLKLLIPNVKININIAKSILEKDLAGVEKLSNQENLEDGIIFGAIFIIAISGATDDIAEKLFSLKESYPKDFLKYVLQMASLFNRTELLPLLLKEDSFSYSTLSHALHISNAIKGLGSNLIERALKRKTMELIPLPNDDTE
ncbi:uncharacterized protein [Palaemon carinicauda]|uniref:uncharacterized protein n=1 Tax=Palaemon carinicauda TaxID=392227 RepID=UPI0035B5C8C3